MSLVAKDLVRSYGAVAALADVSFHVPAGSLCGLIGPNGAGKTTLLSILATLDEDFAGEATVAGISVRDAPTDVRRRLGFVADHPRLYDALTVRELLELFASAAGIAQSGRRRAVDDVVHLCGVEDILARPAAGLSKGQTQRVCVARALLHDPAVLLLDEPASGLDPRARIELKELLKKLRTTGKTVLVSSHILTELGDFCDSVIILERGRVVAAGPVEALHRDVAGASGTARRVLVEVDGDAETAERVLRGVGGVREVIVEPFGEGRRVGALLSCVVDGPRSTQSVMVRSLVAAGVDVVQVVSEKLNLEALFLTLTGRDGGASC